MSNKKNENSVFDNLKPLGDITVDGQLPISFHFDL